MNSKRLKISKKIYLDKISICFIASASCALSRLISSDWSLLDDVDDLTLLSTIWTFFGFSTEKIYFFFRFKMKLKTCLIMLIQFLFYNGRRGGLCYLDGRLWNGRRWNFSCWFGFDIILPKWLYLFSHRKLTENIYT